MGSRDALAALLAASSSVVAHDDFNLTCSQRRVSADGTTAQNQSKGRENGMVGYSRLAARPRKGKAK